jgi:hypothetical protein
MLARTDSELGCSPPSQYLALRYFRATGDLRSVRFHKVPDSRSESRLAARRSRSQLSWRWPMGTSRQLNGVAGMRR